jgi:hypothetical protein
LCTHWRALYHEKNACRPVVQAVTFQLLGLKASSGWNLGVVSPERGHSMHQKDRTHRYMAGPRKDMA